MDEDEQRYLRLFFQNLAKQALEPDDPLYVPIYDDPELASTDPVSLLARRVEWTGGQSVQLFSGFRGTGKSTELRRLKKLLETKGYVVVLFDLGEYVNLHTAIDVPDFLLALAGGLGDALAEAGALPGDPSKTGYWERFSNFLSTTRVEINEVSFEGGAGAKVGLKAALKQDPSFRDKLQERMAGHLGAFVADVREYVEECVRQVRERRHEDTEVVMLVDSVEQIRGTSINAVEVQDSVERLFASHADKLHLPGLHVIYTVPPYLKVRFPGVDSLYEPGGLHMLPAVKVKSRDDGQPYQPGLDVLERVVSNRGDWQRLLGTREVLDELLLDSGGHLRDLFRIVREILTRAMQLPVQQQTVRASVEHVRSSMLPIPDDDVRWLHRIAQTHASALDGRDHLPGFARFLDTHLVLGYVNGEEWYDVHPLVAEHVERQAKELRLVEGRLGGGESG